MILRILKILEQIVLRLQYKYLILCYPAWYNKVFWINLRIWWIIYRIMLFYVCLLLDYFMMNCFSLHHSQELLIKILQLSSKVCRKCIQHPKDRLLLRSLQMSAIMQRYRGSKLILKVWKDYPKHHDVPPTKEWSDRVRLGISAARI